MVSLVITITLIISLHMVIRNIVAHYPYALKINYFLFKQNYTILTKSYAIFKFIP